MKASLYLLVNRHLQRVENLEEIKTILATEHRRFWLDVEAPGQEGVAWLGEQFHFHPLALEDLLQPSYRPKLAEFETHLFLVAHEVTESQVHIAMHEVNSFLTRDYLVTVHNVASNAVAQVQRALEGQPTALARGPDYVLYMLLDQIAESYFHVMDGLDDIIDQLEIDVVGDFHEAMLNRVFDLRHELATMRRVSIYLRDAVTSLAVHEDKYLNRQNTPYFRDVQSLLVTVHELVDNQRDRTTGILEIHLSTLSNRLNSVVNRLTIVATLFLPISFVAAVFGTNFNLMPFDNTVLFAAFLVSLLAIPTGMIVWFRKMEWI